MAPMCNVTGELKHCSAVPRVPRLRIQMNCAEGMVGQALGSVGRESYAETSHPAFQDRSESPGQVPYHYGVALSEFRFSHKERDANGSDKVLARAALIETTGLTRMC